MNPAQNPNHEARVHHALAALQQPHLHYGWHELIQYATFTQEKARISAEQVLRGRQEGHPSGLQYVQRRLAQADAEQAVQAAREKTQFEEDIIRRHEVQLQGPPTQGGYQGVPIMQAHNMVPLPAQELTIAQTLTALLRLGEMNTVRAHEQSQALLNEQKNVVAATRLVAAQNYQTHANQREMIDLLREIRDQNGGAAAQVAGGGPIRGTVQRARGVNTIGRRHSPKQDVVHHGKVIGKGQTLDPTTGNYTSFVCTVDVCGYTTETRLKIRSHFLSQYKK